MTPPYRLDASRQFIPFSKQQLLGMHALIDAKKIDVEKSHSIFQQIERLESTIHDQSYTRSLRRYDAEARLPILLGLLCFVAVILLGLAAFAPTDPRIVKLLGGLSDGRPPAAALSLITAALFATFVISHLYVRARAASLQGKRLSHWWATILQRWLPELPSLKEVPKLAPSTVAQLVAVQCRIQDVDLDLGTSPPDFRAGDTNRDFV